MSEKFRDCISLFYITVFYFKCIFCIELQTFSKKICIAIIIVMVLILTVSILTTFSTPYMIINATNMLKIHDEQLGIASDVIQCAEHHWGHHFSTMTLKENASDLLNDNPKGLPMDVFSLNQADIEYHHYEDVNMDYEIILPTAGINRFIMPYNYYNRPWYMWQDSTIDMSVNIIHTEQLTEARVYLFKGEKAINEFFDDELKLPTFEEVIDLVTQPNTIFWNVKQNDYYYVAVHLKGPKDTILQSNITFNFKYIDTDDYSWLGNSAQHIKGVGETVRLGWSRSSNLTLCYLHPLDRNSLESPSIHIDVSYYVLWNYVLPVVIAPFVVLLCLIILVIVFVCIRTRAHGMHSQYTPIN